MRSGHKEKLMNVVTDFAAIGLGRSRTSKPDDLESRGKLVI
jgi:hypothetical protein